MPMTIGGDPGGITGNISGYERMPDEDRKGVRTDWMVVYLHPSRKGELYTLRAMFMNAAGMSPNAQVQAAGGGVMPPVEP